MKAKPGVIFISPHPAVLFALEVIYLWWRKTFATDPVVTSGRDGGHSEKSLHYGSAEDFRERAFDLRTRDLNLVQQKNAEESIRTLLGPMFDVVLERDHLHVEYQPKI